MHFYVCLEGISKKNSDIVTSLTHLWIQILTRVLGGRTYLENIRVSQGFEGSVLCLIHSSYSSLFSGYHEDRSLCPVPVITMLSCFMSQK